MKKKLILLFLLAIIPNNTFAENLSVKANIPSGEYDFVLDVYLISNEKDSKIFYYTDGEGRMDKQIEFINKNPILIKENTTLDYYALGSDFNSTKIEENIYKLNFTKDLELSYNDKKINIKNTSSKIQNIGYRNIESSNLIYEINKNTFIEKNETFSIPYSGDIGEEISLISPDKKNIIKLKIEKPLEKIIEAQKKENEEESIENNDILISDENINSGDLLEENKENINSGEVIKNIETKQETDINEELKASVLDKTPENKNNFIYLFLIIFIGFIFSLFEKFKKEKK